MILTRFVKIQLLVFAVISVVGMAYVGANYVGIPRLLGSGYTVVAKFADSGGIFANAEVTYRGVSVGRVDHLRLTDDGVAVAMRINDDARIPASTVAEVHNRSSVGEQYIDLLPQSRGGPFLHDGSVIPRRRTDIPIQVTTVMRNLDQLVNSVGKKNLATVIDEMGKAFERSGPDLQRLIDSGNALIKESDTSLPATRKLINDGETVLETQRETSSAIKAFSENLASFSGQLRKSDADFRSMLDEGTGASVQLSGLFQDVQPTLPILFSNLITMGEVTKLRLPAMEQILLAYPLALAGTFTVAPGDGTAHFGQVEGHDPPACTEGYEPTKRTYPQNTGYKEAPRHVYCKEDDDRSIDVRGTRYGPSGVPEGGSGSQNAGSQGSASQGSPQSSGQSQNASLPTGRSQTSSNGLGTVFSGYDPVTGRILGSSGVPYYLGSTGGQERVMGEESWKWLLLGPLGR